MSVFVGISSNLDYPVQQVHNAIVSLALIPNTHITGLSNLYLTAPIGYDDQPDFINAVIRCETRLLPHEFLSHCKTIENSQGRVRNGIKNGPRTIDLDVLLFDQLEISDAELIVPHPRMKHRAFVLVPLADIDNDLIFPDGTKLQSLLDSVKDQHIRSIKEEEGVL